MTKQFNRLSDDKSKKSAVWHEFKIVEQYPLHKIKAIMARREKLKTAISEQILMASDRSYMPMKYKWVPQPDGDVKRVTVPTKTKRWWQQLPDGRYQIVIKYRGKMLELEAGKEAIEVSDWNDLVPTFKRIITSIDQGDFDLFL